MPRLKTHRCIYHLSMERTLVTVDPNGQLTLPSQIPAALGLSAGTEVEIVTDGNCITLSPRRPARSAEEVKLLVKELQDMFRGKPSLEDELYEMRREEAERSLRKFGC
jgi:AbrB family looped-hinge helix DNA binding protein